MIDLRTSAGTSALPRELTHQVHVGKLPWRRSSRVRPVHVHHQDDRPRLDARPD